MTTPQAYFTTVDGSWFTPTNLARGPWSPDACHGGPPTSLVVRALEQLDIDHRLVRLTMDLRRPIPMAGFGVMTTVDRTGRMAATATARIVDGNEETCATATALLLTPEHVPTPTSPIDSPDFAASIPGPFPVPRDRMGDLRFFSHSVQARWDPASDPNFTPTGPDATFTAKDLVRTEGGGLGSSTMWLRTVDIVAGEEPSPLQRLGPIADCGNGVSANVAFDVVTCINPDVTLTVLRPPVGRWLALRATTHTGDDGIGFSDAHLFDRHGLVGRTTQSLVLRPD